jgi:hypothetical protein
VWRQPYRRPVDVTGPFASHPRRTAVVGLALDGRDDAPLALADLLALAFDAHLALVHAYPYESLGRATDDHEQIVREDAIGGLESAATSVQAADVSVRAYGRALARPGRLVLLRSRGRRGRGPATATRRRRWST